MPRPRVRLLKPRKRYEARGKRGEERTTYANMKRKPRRCQNCHVTRLRFATSYGDHSGKFATANLSQPVSLHGGGTSLPIPQLTSPRSLTVLYTFGLGGKAPAPNSTASPNAKK